MRTMPVKQRFAVGTNHGAEALRESKTVILVQGALVLQLRTIGVRSCR